MWAQTLCQQPPGMGTPLPSPLGWASGWQRPWDDASGLVHPQREEMRLRERDGRLGAHWVSATPRRATPRRAVRAQSQRAPGRSERPYLFISLPSSPSSLVTAAVAGLLNSFPLFAS